MTQSDTVLCIIAIEMILLLAFAIGRFPGKRIALKQYPTLDSQCGPYGTPGRPAVPGSVTTLDPDQGIRWYKLDVLREMEDDEAMRDVIALLIHNLPREIRRLQDLCLAGRWPELRQLACKLKGTFSIVRADPVVAMLGQLENEAAHTDTEGLAVRMPELVRLTGILQSQLCEEYRRLNR